MVPVGGAVLVRGVVGEQTASPFGP